jgi:O-antigen/teichoic acid export membrane protein
MKPAKTLLSNIVVSEENGTITATTGQRLTLPLFFSWAKNGGFAVLDQGLISGSNFLVNILLARWLTPTDYGAFAFAFSIFLLLSGTHNSLLLEPMSVLGPANHRHRLKEYLGSLVWIHVGLTCGIAAVLMLAAGAMIVLGAQAALGTILVSAALALPVILLFWFARRAFYLEGKPSGALRGSLVYSASLVVGLMYLNHLSLLSAFAAFLLMALASLVASGALLYRLRPRPFIGYKIAEISPRRIIRENWGYGKWVLAITLVHWLSGDVYYILVTAFLGFEEAGVLRALQNLVMPITQATTAMGLLLLPQTSGRLASNGFATLKEDVYKITILNAVLTTTYFLILLAFGDKLLHLMYGDKYAEFAYLLPYLIAVPVVMALGSGVQTGLRVLQVPWVIFAGYCVTAILTLSVGVGFVRLWGLLAVAIGGLIGAGSLTIVVIWYWKRTFYEGKEGSLLL